MEWIWIPIVAILAGSFSEWLKFRQKQDRLGTSTHALEKEVAQMREERQRMVERIQNLEAIVTHEAWDTMEPEESISPDLPSIEIDEPSDQERIAGLAKKLRS